MSESEEVLRRMDSDYKRVVDAKINELRIDVNALKSSSELLHQEVRQVISGVADMQSWVKDNAQVTRDVRDILGTFHFMGSAGKWITTVGAACVLTYGAVKGWFVK